MTSKLRSLKNSQVPEKIAEIISYLAHDFAKNNLFEYDDLQQDLYVLYFNLIKNKPSLADQKPGYFFIKFKWFLLTKWRKRINTLNKEWKFKAAQLREGGIKDGMEHEDYTNNPYEDLTKKEKRTPRYKKYNF